MPASFSRSLHGWMLVDSRPSWLLETGTKGPEEQRQVGSVVVRASGSVGTKCWESCPPPAPGQGQGHRTVFYASLLSLWLLPKSPERGAFSALFVNQGNCIHLKGTGFGKKRKLFGAFRSQKNPPNQKGLRPHHVMPACFGGSALSPFSILL